MQDNRVRWQIDCDNTIKDKNNVILSSPTGSGKTKRYEIWALNKKERPIFITSPIKSLSNQKFRDLKEAGYNVGIETGDIKYIPDNCDIICCTQEIYNNKYIDYSDSTLIIDEFSYIFEDQDRARAYIDSLHYSKAENIIICSATLGNTKEIKEYINRVTNRNFFLYENKERLTTLEYKGQIKKENIKNSLVVAYSRVKCKEIATSIYEYRKNTKEKNKQNYDKIEHIAKKYNVENRNLIKLCTLGVGYYYGTLYPKEKLFIEELFENKLIDTVVGTDALALGVNFPIENVIFAELTKKNQINKVISKNLFEQLSGRAGRKGYFDNGYIYYCSDFEENIKKKKELDELFFELINKKNENSKFSLTPDIRAILSKEKTIEEEAKYIVEYSTNKKSLNEEIKKITEIIDFINNIDIASFYIKEKYKNLNFNKGIYKAIEKLPIKQQNKILELSYQLISLQKQFEKNIKDVYFQEYSYEQNCLIFIDILNGVNTNELIEKYGNEFKQLLLLRNYISKLPQRYSKYFNITLIERKIDSLDHTVLHPFNIKELNTEYENGSKKIKPNIRGVIENKITIDEEARRIIEYSQTRKNIEDEKNKLKNVIEFINNIDIASFYIKKNYGNLDYSKGTYEAIINAPLKIREKLKYLSIELMHLQKQFDEDIKDAYFYEYSPKLNSLIFIDILRNISLNTLIKNYGNEINKLIILKEYLENLPEKYSKLYDINKINELIKYMYSNDLKIIGKLTDKEINKNKINKR